MTNGIGTHLFNSSVDAEGQYRGKSTDWDSWLCLPQIRPNKVVKSQEESKAKKAGWLSTDEQRACFTSTTIFLHCTVHLIKFIFVRSSQFIKMDDQGWKVLNVPLKVTVVLNYVLLLGVVTEMNENQNFMIVVDSECMCLLFWKFIKFSCNSLSSPLKYILPSLKLWAGQIDRLAGSTGRVATGQGKWGEQALWMLIVLAQGIYQKPLKYVLHEVLPPTHGKFWSFNKFGMYLES